MSALAWIVASGVAMALVALVGSTTLVLSEAMRKRIVTPLVALAAGTLLGGAFFHLLPHGIEELGAEKALVWLAIGFTSFFLVESILHGRHTHLHRQGRTPETSPVAWLVLLADALHNVTGGLAVGAAFLVDVRLGISAWLAAAAHEVPQELGDFGVLVHGGFSAKRALLWNFMSGLTFLVGGLIAWAASGTIDVAVILPFAAGNFLYIAGADLVPEVHHQEHVSKRILHAATFVAGLLALWLLREVGH